MTNNIPVKTFVFDNKYYFYDAYKNNIICISKELFIEINKLLRVGIDLYSEQAEKTSAYYEVTHLIRKGYFKSNFIDKIEHPLVFVADSLIDRGLNSLILQVSCDCNFKCRYCSYAVENNINRSHNNQYMSFETAKKSINYLYEHSKDSDVVTISFYGGEPLLNFELIKQVVNYTEKLFEFKHIIYSMTTNLSLLNDEIAEFTILHNFRLTISMDGPEEIQNNHRKFWSTGADTYDIVMKNINLIRNKNGLFFKRNVRFNSVIFRDESYKEVMSFFNSLGVDSSQIECTYAYVSGIDYIEQYSNNKNMKNDIKTFDMIDEFMDKKLIDKMNVALKDKSKIPNVWHHNGPCVPGINRLFVDIKGNFYPCERIVETSCTVIGNIDKGLDIERIKKIMNIGELTQHKCKGCWAMRFCDLCASKCIDIDNDCLSFEQKEHMCKYIYYQAERYINQFILAKGKVNIDE